MGDIRTPRQAKGPGALKILKKTTQSVYMGKLPPRSNRNLHHSHALKAARQVKRIDRQPWEERVAEILKVVEEHRHGRANAMHGAIERASIALDQVSKKKAEVETYAEEMKAANEEMRAANEEMRANAEEMRAANEEMRAANEELRAVSEELERIHTDQERLLPLVRDQLLVPLSRFREHALGAADQLDARGREQMDFIADHATRIERILENTLTYWQVDVEGKTLEVTDCETLLGRVLEELDPDIQARRAVVTHDTLPEALVDPPQFTQLLSVLITNALQYGPADGAEIHIRAESIAQSQVQMPISDLELGWLFSVKDNGGGIAEEDQERIFQIFESAAGRDESVGMGLAIAWRIVKRHGGHIWVESTPGRGSTFYFTIPEYELPDGEPER